MSKISDLEARGRVVEVQEAVDRAFGAENRNRLIDRYFRQSAQIVSPQTSWQHVYRMLLWSDPTIGLAHCYESDKAQPGKPWYARSLAFHDWLSTQFGVEPDRLAGEIDWLFVKASADLAEASLRREARQAQVAAEQRAKYGNRGLPEPGADPELTEIMRGVLSPFLINSPPDDVWRMVTQRSRQFLALQNKRKNLVGEGFEDVLAQIVRRACNIDGNAVRVRTPLHEIPGFNRSKRGGKENKVDVCVLQPQVRILVTAKWSVRADREKQFTTEYDEYVKAESENQKFEYVFVTNEFDPARLKRACEARYGNSAMFDRVVHINPSAVEAAYGALLKSGGRRNSGRSVVEHIESGRLISLEQWLNSLAVLPH